MQTLRGETVAVGRTVVEHVSGFVGIGRCEGIGVRIALEKDKSVEE